MHSQPLTLSDLHGEMFNASVFVRGLNKSQLHFNLIPHKWTTCINSPRWGQVGLPQSSLYWVTASALRLCGRLTSLSEFIFSSGPDCSRREGGNGEEERGERGKRKHREKGRERVCVCGGGWPWRNTMLLHHLMTPSQTYRLWRRGECFEFAVWCKTSWRKKSVKKMLSSPITHLQTPKQTKDKQTDEGRWSVDSLLPRRSDTTYSSRFSPKVKNPVRT